MPRIKPLRAHFIPKGARKIAHKQSSAVLYAYENDNFVFLLGFAGKRQKPDFHYRYAKAQKGEERRLAKGESYFEAMAAREAIVKDRRAKPHELAVGDILRASWGYDQTNIDYYEVLRLIGKSMVEISEIKAASVELQSMVGKSVPLPGAYKGEPMRKRADGNSVRIASYASAYKMVPQIIGGVKTYEASNWTAYA